MTNQVPTQSVTSMQLEDLKQAGFPVEKGQRSAHLPRYEGVNRKILQTWLPRWCLHSAQNYPVVSRAWGVRALQASAKGLPAIVVGIGPSLDKNADLLLNAPHNAIIIATDAALRPLAARGVRPHLVLTYDCKKEQASLFAGVDTRDLVLLANSCTHPDTICAWQGKMLFFNMEHAGVDLLDTYLPNLYPQLGGMINLGTVGNMALMLAYQLGCSKILSVGMDLCYQEAEPGNGYRYRCNDFEWVEPPAHDGIPPGWRPRENKLLYNNEDRMRDTNEEEVKGKKYIVDSELRMYRQILIDLVGKFDDGVQYIDCSEGGVLQDIVKTMKLKDALIEFCNREIAAGESTIPHLNKIVPDVQDAGGGNK